MLTVSLLVSMRRGASHYCVIENQHRLYPMVGGVMLAKGMRRTSVQDRGQYVKNTAFDVGVISDLTNVKVMSHVNPIMAHFCLRNNLNLPVLSRLICGS